MVQKLYPVQLDPREAHTVQLGSNRSTQFSHTVQLDSKGQKAHSIQLGKKACPVSAWPE